MPASGRHRPTGSTYFLQLSCGLELAGVADGPPTDCTDLSTTILPSSGAAEQIVHAVASPIVAYSLVVVYVTKYVLEKKHRTVTTTFAKAKQVELQEQLQLLSRQMAKKDQKLAFFEKAREKRSAGP